MPSHQSPQLNTSSADAQPEVSDARYSSIIQREAESRNLNKSQKTAMRLKIAAADLLEDRSVTDLRVGDIAERAGVAHGTFYTHYKNSREIIQAILDEYFDILDRKLRPGLATDEFARIRDTNAAFIRFYRQNLGLMRCIRALSEQDPVFAAQKRQIDATWYNRNIAHLSRTEASKNMSTEKIRFLVYALGSMVEDFLYVRFQNPDPIVVDMTRTEEDAAEKLAEIWYRTIYLRDPSDR